MSASFIHGLALGLYDERVTKRIVQIVQKQIDSLEKYQSPVSYLEPQREAAIFQFLLAPSYVPAPVLVRSEPVFGRFSGLGSLLVHAN